MEDLLPSAVWLAVTLFLLATACLVARRLFPRDGLAATAVQALILAWSSLCCCSLVLGAAGLLRPTMLIACVAVCCLAAMIAVRAAGKRMSQRRGERRVGWSGGAWGVAWALVASWLVARVTLDGLLQFPKDWDTLAYHLPLDKHTELGNNARAAKALGVSNREEFAEVGLVGDVEPMGIDALEDRVRSLYQSDPLTFKEGPAEIRRIAICSGGAQRHVMDAVEAGADAYITGEVSEYVLHQAREEGIHFIAAGHHATERPGVKALAEHLAEKFGVGARFIDVPNPV